MLLSALVLTFVATEIHLVYGYVFLTYLQSALSAELQLHAHIYWLRMNFPTSNFTVSRTDRERDSSDVTQGPCTLV
ncbi:hypothetical protein BKA62DRAFT_689145 [Auriculariales sp. MPI-PUGE-AT-0066]|nr:hypothetical protein BKA62DRAFT_689145 [Auriculariales sp. MPI-PUGE-AT-0066]